VVFQRAWNTQQLEQNSIPSIEIPVLELFLGSKDNTSRASREGSMGPLSRQSSTASVGSCCSSSQDAGTSQFF